jgi:hypothetical protein
MGPVLGVLDDRYARRATSPRPHLVRTPHFAPDGPQRPAQTPLGKAGGCHSLARGSQASNPLTSPPARRSTHPGAWLLVLPHHGRERSTAGLNAQIHCSPQTISGRAQSKRRRSIRNGMRACQRRLRWRPAFALWSCPVSVDTVVRLRVLLMRAGARRRRAGGSRGSNGGVGGCRRPR